MEKIQNESKHERVSLRTSFHHKNLGSFQAKSFSRHGETEMTLSRKRRGSQEEAQEEKRKTGRRREEEEIRLSRLRLDLKREKRRVRPGRSNS